MSSNGAREPIGTSVKRMMLDMSRPETATATKLKLMAIVLSVALATTFIVTVAGLGYLNNVHTAAIRNERVLDELNAIKANALSTILLDAVSPETKTIFGDAERVIQISSRWALENITQLESSRDLEAILSQWRDYDRDSKELIRHSASDPKAAKEGIASLYKRKFTPFQNNLEAFIKTWSAMTKQTELDAAVTIRTIKWSVSALILLIAGIAIVMLLVTSRSINANLHDREENFRKLQQSETLMDATQKIANVGGWEFDVQKQTLFWTDEVYRIHDIAREYIPPGSTQHIDRSVECYAPESRPVILAAFQKCAVEGVPYDMEFPFTSVKGRRMWIRTAGKPVFENGKIVKVLGHIMDITERKIMEDRITAERNKLLSVIESLEDGVYIVNRDCEIEYINPVIKREFGPVNGRKCHLYFHDLMEPCPWCKNPEVFSGKSVRWEWYLKKNDRHYDIFDTPIKNADGSVSKFEIFHDVTEHKKMQEALRESEALFRNYFDLGQVGMAVTSLDQKWLRVNDRLSEMLGYTKDELTKMTWTELTHPDDLEPDWAQFKKLLSGKIERYELDKRFLHKNGAVIYTHLTVACQRKLDRSVEYFIASLDDITARKAAEKELAGAKDALQASEARLEEAQRIGRLGFLDWDLITNEIECSDETLRIYGLEAKAEKLKLEDITKLVHPDDVGNVEKALNNAIRNGVKHHIEHRIVRSDGTVVCVDSYAEIFRDATGKPIRMLGTNLDITARKQAEEALQISELRFRQTLENMLEGCMILGFDWTYLYLNDISAQHGLNKRENLIGRTILEMYPGVEKSAVFAHYKRCMEERIPQRFEESYSFADGKTLWYEFSAVPVPEGIFVVSIDITTRKTYDRALEEYGKRLVDAQRIAKVGDWTWNLSGNSLTWSDELYHLFGVDKETYVPALEKYVNLVHPDDRPIMLAVNYFEHIGKKTHSTEYRVITQDTGEVKYVLNRGETTFGEDGKPLFVRGTLQDITERKTTEQNLMAAKESAEEATKLKDKFISLVAHDLKGPLGSIVGFMKQLGRTSSSEEDAGKIYSIAISTSENMLTMIDELLSISRIKTGKLKPRMKFISAYYFAVKAMADFKYRAEEKGVKLVNDVSKDTRLFADESLFYEVVRNLMSNAIKFTFPGKSVRIFTPEGKPSSLAVSDEGLGIDEARLPHLFEYETKTSTTGTAGELGTGLGLPLSRDIVVAHGGKLTVESVRGKGTVFCAELPHVKPKVLFVCDDRLATMFAEQCVRDMGLEFKSATNGSEAIAALGAWKPDLVITDVKMPGMDGFELVSNMRQNLATANIPIIMTSAYTDPDLAARVASAHVDDFIAKPFIAEELASKIRRILR